MIIRMPLAYSLTDEQFDQCRKALVNRPKEQWPSIEMWERVAASVRLKQMENAEAHAARAALSQAEGGTQ